MTEKSCRCGASKKRFKVDIGPFYIADCCEEAGFDNLGNRSKPEVIVEAREAPKPVEKVEESKKESKSLKSMTLEELKALADERGVQGTESMSRKKLMAALKK